MDKSTKKLIDCLEKEIEIYKKLLSLARQEKEILVRNDESQLEEVVKKQNLLVDSITEQEDKRLEIVSEIASSKGYGKKGVFEKIIRDAEKKYPGMVRIKIKKIKNLVTEISEINNNNIFLIKQGKKNIKSFFDIILKQYDSKVYSNNGRFGNKVNKTILLDRRL